MNKEDDENIELAKNAMKNSHNPYSDFKVGAVLITKNGKKYIGCNVANHGIQSICAERVAFVKAISEGEKEFEKILVIGGKDQNSLQECLPCGYCRQFISEFVESNFKIQTYDGENLKEYDMETILPFRFKI